MMLGSLFTVVATATLALGASLQAVSSFGKNPTNIQMYIYVPDKVAAKPAIIVAVGLLLACLPSSPGPC